MIERLAKEIKICLDNKCYISALTLAVMLPDICGKAEYPDIKGVGDRYRQWFQKFIVDKKLYSIKMTADIAYSLRCCLLHEGNPAIDNKKCNVKKFAFIVRENSACVPIEEMFKRIDPNGNETYESYNIGVNFFCGVMLDAAMRYYKSNQAKFNFTDYRFINTTDERARIFGLNEDCIRVEL